MYTIDTSVWVNATEPGEPDHAQSRALLRRLHAHALPVIVPVLVLVEVSGTVCRLRNEARAAQITRMLAGWRAIIFVDLDRTGADRAALLARSHRLRGADAVYAAVAQLYGTTLISRDREHLTRLGTIVAVQTPAEALAALSPDTP
jgi:predicted nucleic acid-binding protein